MHYVSIHNCMGQMESTLKDPGHLKPDYQKFQTLKPINSLKPYPHTVSTFELHLKE